MCQATSTPNQDNNNSTMLSPYHSYIQMLLPVGSAATCDRLNFSSSEKEELTTEVVVKICFDNARPLTDQASMTMRSLQVQKITKVCRWSSVPDLVGASLKASTNSSALRSSEDLRNLRTQNSRLPRSSDNLRNLARASSKKEDEPARQCQNDRWNISNTKNKANKAAKRPQVKNPFDLSIPGLPLPVSSTASRPQLTTPGAGTVQRLKAPQRKHSIESDSKLKTILNRFETTLQDEYSENSATSSDGSPGSFRIIQLGQIL